MNLTGCYWLLLWLCVPALCFAGDTDTHDQLQKTRRKIEQTSDHLREQKSAEKELLRDLSIVKTSIKKIDSRINSISQEKQKISKELATARKEYQLAEQRLKSFSGQVNERLVALYKEGETGPLKLFFSSDSPMELVQQYHYLTKVLEYDRSLLGQFRASLDQLRAKKSQFEQLEAQQKKLLEAEEKNRVEEAAAQKSYNQILKKVRKDKVLLTQQLNQLQARAQRLEQLVKQLDVETKEKKVAPNEQFASLKGLLPWPVDGSVAVGFGTQHNEALGSVLESHGIEVTYRSSQPVRAVAQGRIVFASWFKGYGNLTIVAHDDGFHTLYAQVERLDKSVGDIVRQGDVIAETGDPDGPGLYFEIRHNGSPVDPQKWLMPN